MNDQQPSIRNRAKAAVQSAFKRRWPHTHVPETIIDDVADAALNAVAGWLDSKENVWPYCAVTCVAIAEELKRPAYEVG